MAVFATACSSGEEPETGAPTTSIDLVTGEVPPPVDAPTVELSAEELGGLRFTDVTAQAGLDRDRSTRELLGEDGMTGPVSVVDVDGDGRSDLFLPRTGDVNSLYRNDGDGTFTDVAGEAGLLGPNPQFGTGPAVFFDADGDGDQDAYLAAVGAESDRLYRNDGTGRFADVTVESGVFQPPPTRLRNGDQVHGLDVGDVDLDGDLDLVVVQWDTAVPENAANAGNIGVARVPTASVDAPAGTAPDPEPIGAYRAAWNQLKAGDVPAAISGFTRFVAQWPSHSYSDNALFLVGEARLGRAETAAALSAFRRVVDEYPSGNKVPDALYMIGVTLDRMGRATESKETLARLVAMYPETDAARRAQEALRSRAL